MEAARHPWPALGVLLVRDGLVSREELEAVVEEQGDERGNRLSSRRLGEALVERGLVTGDQVARLVAEQHELPFVDLYAPDAMVPVPVRLPADLARSHCALPIRAFPDGSLLVVVGDPTRPGCFDDVRAALGVPVRFAVASPDAIVAAIETLPETASPAEVAEHADDREERPSAEASEAVDTGVVADLESRRAPEPRAGVGPWPLLGSLLLRDGLVSADDLYAALAQQRLSSTKRLGEILLARGSLTEEALSRTLAEQHELPFVEPGELQIDRDAASLLPLDVARAHLALPVSHVDDVGLLVVVADPVSAVHADELRAALRVPLVFAVATSEDIESAIESLAAPSGPEPAPEQLEHDEVPLAALSGPEPAPEQLERDEVPLASHADRSEEPVARDAVNDVLEQAVSAGATAVHFTRDADGLSVRARIGGTMTELRHLSGSEAAAADTTLAELDAVGRDTVVAGNQTIELRPTTLATTLGRRTTFRFVTEEQPASAFDHVFPADVSRALRDALERPAGLVVLCGAAAESRSAELRATMRELVAPERLVLSVEDPVEFLVSGVGQTEVNALSGQTYAAALQSILRSDPDVAVVDQLLDAETARLAVRGARRRLVLTTLDAPTPVSAARRLVDFGISPRALADAGVVVVGHAVVRRLCEDCRESYYAAEDELVQLGRPLDELGRRLLGRGRGCDACAGTGYRGGVDIFEVLPIAPESGVRTLYEHAVDLCLDGLTAADELRDLGLSGTPSPFTNESTTADMRQ
jgi:type IV pilus assembly protein PilB